MTRPNPVRVWRGPRPTRPQQMGWRWVCRWCYVGGGRLEYGLVIAKADTHARTCIIAAEAARLRADRDHLLDTIYTALQLACRTDAHPSLRDALEAAIHQRRLL